MSDITPEDALQVAQRALSKANGLERDLEELREEYEETADELAAISLRLSEQDDERAYRDYTLDEKVGMVREHAFRKATDGHGRAKLDYDGVMWEVFDGEPGPSHCYKLLRLAAGLDDVDDTRPTGGTIDGFRCRDPDGENYHLAVDAERAKQNFAFYPENKTPSEEVR